MKYQWLGWAKRIQALSQSGLTFSKDKFDIERYEELRKISAEIISAYTDTKMEKIPDLFMNETGYQTPKVDVRGVVFKGEKILLVHERDDDKWSLPGGYCEIGSSPSENVVKEVKEESGFQVHPYKLLAVLDMDKHPHPPHPYQIYKIFIQCELLGGKAVGGLETKGVGFFSKDELPPLSTPRNTPSQIQMLFEFLRDEEKPPLFD